MRVLVLGGTNFIGPETVRHLAAMGHEVAVFHRGQTEGDLPEGVRHLHGDRNELAEHLPAFRGFGPEVVLDMIPLGEADGRATVETFRGLARRAVAVSSLDVYRAFGRLLGTEPGPPEPGPLTEDSPLREKLYPYRGPVARGEDDPARRMDDYDKILVERAILGEPALPGTVVRLPMVYGPRDRQHRFWAYLKRMDDGRPAIVLPAAQARWRTTRGYLEDVGLAIALATADDRAAGRVYHVAEREALAEEDLVRELGRVVGWDGEVVVVPEGEDLPEHLAAGADLGQDLVADASRIRAELGYEERVPREEAFRRTVAWERVNPPAEDPAAFDYAAEDALLARLG